MFFQIQGRIEVPDGHQRFDIVFAQFFEDIAIEFDALLIGFIFIAMRIETAPGNGHSKHLEAHFGKQGNVFFIVMVKIDGVMVGVEIVIENGVMSIFGQCGKAPFRVGMRIPVFVDPGYQSMAGIGATSGDIRFGRTAAAFISGAFRLVDSNRVAPEKILWKWHVISPCLALLSVVIVFRKQNRTVFTGLAVKS